MDYGGTGQFTNCYWEYLSYLDTNNQLTSTHRTYISHYWGKKLQTLDNVLWGMIKDLFKNKNLKNWQQFAASYFLGGKTRKKKFVFSTRDVFCWYQTLIKTDLIDLFSKGISHISLYEQHNSEIAIYLSLKQVHMFRHKWEKIYFHVQKKNIVIIVRDVKMSWSHITFNHDMYQISALGCDEFLSR